MSFAPIRTADLLAGLHADLERQRALIMDGWRGIELSIIGARPARGKWSALDCLEHVRRANNLYLGNIHRAVTRAEADGRRPVESFQPGMIGERARASFEPKAPAADGHGRITLRFPTLGGYDPTKDKETMPAEVIFDGFDAQNSAMSAMVKRLERVDLHVRTRTLFGPFLQLRIGDVMRYLITHGDRHFVQGERAMDRARGADSSAS